MCQINKLLASQQITNTVVVGVKVYKYCSLKSLNKVLDWIKASRQFTADSNILLIHYYDIIYMTSIHSEWAIVGIDVH